MFWRAVRAEFHNQRYVFYSGAVFAVLLYVLPHFVLRKNPGLNYELYRLAVSMIFISFGSCAGSLTLGQERFSSRIPIARFLLKLIVGSLSAMISSLLVVVVLTLSVQLNSSDSVIYSLLDTVYPDLAYLPNSIIYFPGSFISFSCSILFSLVFSRRLLSAALGFSAGTAALISTSFFWLRLDFAPWERVQPLFSAMLLSGVLLLVCFLIFWRHSAKCRPMLRFILAFSAIPATGFTASALIFLMQFSPGSLQLWKPVLSPTGRDVVSYATGNFVRQIWTIPTEPRGRTVIVKRHAYDAEISPDGRRISYLSQEGQFGLRSFRVDLRTATIDGTKETILFRQFARWRSDEVGIGVIGKAFSPDSKRIALLGVTALYVFNLEGKRISRAPIPKDSVTRLLGWHPDNSAVLLLDFDRKCIDAYDLSTKQFRTMYRITQDPQLWIPIDSYTGIRFVLFGNELVDLDSGIVQILPGEIHFPELSIDHKILSYSFSTDFHNSGNSFAKVYRFFVRTGHNELIGEFRGAASHMAISPDGSGIAVELRTGFNQLQTVVMHDNSLARKFEGWGVVGWRDANRVVLTNDRFSTKRLALGDIATGQVRQFYP